MTWNGKDLGTPRAISSTVAKSTEPAVSPGFGRFESAFISWAPGLTASFCENRSSCGKRLSTRSTLETPPANRGVGEYKLDMRFAKTGGEYSRVDAVDYLGQRLLSAGTKRGVQCKQHPGILSKTLEGRNMLEGQEAICIRCH